MTSRASDTIHALLTQPGRRVHLMGVGGVGMAGLAFLLKQRGHVVTGCDLKASRLTHWLESQGIPVTEGHDASHVGHETDWLIRTSATPLDAPEIQAAINAGIPVHRRGEVLPVLFEGVTSIAVAGTHGKTTTTTFVTQLLRAAGRDPSWCIGGESEALGGVAGVGKGGLLVVEADESDGTLADYHPDIAVVTNVDTDHLDHFHTQEAIESCFRVFVQQTRGRVVYCGEDVAATRVCANRGNAVSYGIDNEATVYARNVELGPDGSRFRVQHGATDVGMFELPVPGRHNVLNALAAISVCLILGFAPSELKAAMLTLRLPGRRFQNVLHTENIRIINDYAHHPREIAALVETARLSAPSRLVAVFQPHRYSRTAALASEFPAAFKGIDELILLPVYAASESALVGGTHWDLYEQFRMAELARQIGYQTRVATSSAQAMEYLRWHMTTGDTVLLVGAGSIESLTQLADHGETPFLKDRIAGIKHELEQHLVAEGAADGTVLTPRERIGPRTTIGVGGSADLWVEAGDRAALASALRFCRTRAIPVHIIGTGANVLVGDLGLRGVTLRLAGPEFHRLEEGPDSVIVGAGVSVMRLLRWTMERGFAGFEFLDGIPATVGGAARMNAGAYGHEICERIRSITCMDNAGIVHELEDDALDFTYRRCRGVGDKLVLAVTFATDVRGEPDVIKRDRAVIREKRAHWGGLRCAGSIFKNPPGTKAWELVDRIGYRGKRIGGALVNPKHANVIVTEDGALASDVRALIEQIRQRVHAECGVLLEPEVTLFD